VIQYLFRKPKYPVLIETDEIIMGARSGERIGRLCKQSYIVIDSSGEGWSFFPAHHAQEVDKGKNHRTVQRVAGRNGKQRSL
jgi:hypothetical protein